MVYRRRRRVHRALSEYKYKHRENARALNDPKHASAWLSRKLAALVEAARADPALSALDCHWLPQWCGSRVVRGLRFL
jgi:hypothetical protein